MIPLSITCFPYKDKVTDPNKLSMVVYKLKCLTEGCDASYIGESKRICNVRMEDHESDPKSHVYEHHKLPGLIFRECRNIRPR